MFLLRMCAKKGWEMCTLMICHCVQNCLKFNHLLSEPMLVLIYLDLCFVVSFSFWGSRVLGIMLNNL